MYRQYQSGEKNELIYLVGNKIDLGEKVRVVSKEEGENFCIKNLFQNITKELVDVEFKENENIKLKMANEKKSYNNSCFQEINHLSNNIKNSLRHLFDQCGLRERKID